MTIRNLKYTTAFILALILGVLNCFSVEAKNDITRPTERFFINDYADVLSSETENYIFETSKKYYNDNGTQIVVLTIPTLNGNSIEEYSLSIARDWGIGNKEASNGVLILLALEEREIRIEVGYGLEGVITDSLSGRFIREVSAELQADDFNTGIGHLYDLVIQELEEPGVFSENVKSNNNGGVIRTIFLMILLLILFIGRGGRRGFGFFGGYGGFGGMGGFGSGNSGGGGFRGGGGGFGGGGASGKF